MMKVMCSHWVEGESLYWVDCVYAVDYLAVALECILLGLNFGCGVEELDSDAPLDRGRGVSCAQDYR